MIDVKECEFYLNGDCTLIDNCLGAKRPFVDKTNPYCSCYEDCYYKQLQQALEENRVLTANSVIKDKVNQDLTILNNNLLQENEELKKDNEYWKRSFDKEALLVREIEDENDDLKIENEELLKIVKPRMSDFTGYDEKTNSFDIVLAIKEIIEELEETIASKEVAIERLLNPESEDEE